jgi:hypothetical protein
LVRAGGDWLLDILDRAAQQSASPRATTDRVGRRALRGKRLAEPDEVEHQAEQEW